jgi:hypothetical protein
MGTPAPYSSIPAPEPVLEPRRTAYDDIKDAQARLDRDLAARVQKSKQPKKDK